jgi:hypothetical protein
MPASLKGKVASAYGAASDRDHGRHHPDGNGGHLEELEVALWATAALMVPFLLIDTTFLSANLLKVGGWVPLLIGALVMLVIFTWRKGANILV